MRRSLWGKPPSLKALCWTYFVCSVIYYIALPWSDSISALLGFDGPVSFFFLGLVLAENNLLPPHLITAYLWIALDIALLVAFLASLVLACFKKYSPLGITAAASTAITLLLVVLAAILNEPDGNFLQTFIPGLVLNVLFCVLYFYQLQKKNKPAETTFSEIPVQGEALSWQKENSIIL